MAENSAIEWTDHTFNPWEGCQKVGPGCDHCYAETRNARFGGGTAPNWGPGAPRRRTSPGNWRKPLAWNADARRFAEEHGRKQRVFCASLADVFDNAVDPAWRADLFALIDKTPNLDWLLLTKRIGNVPAMVRELGRETLPVHVWLGATVVNQAEADRDVPKLLAAPAVIRFLSMEPLLGPVNLRSIKAPRYDFEPEDSLELDWRFDALEVGDYYWFDGEHGQPGDSGDGPYRDDRIDWIIVGGESGPGARPMHPDWVRSIRDQCATASLHGDDAPVPFLFKQWGEWMPDPNGDRCLDIAGRNMPNVEPCGSNGDGTVRIARVGKKAAGRLLDGVTHDGMPA